MSLQRSTADPHSSLPGRIIPIAHDDGDAYVFRYPASTSCDLAGTREPFRHFAEPDTQLHTQYDGDEHSRWRRRQHWKRSREHRRLFRSFWWRQHAEPSSSHSHHDRRNRAASSAIHVTWGWKLFRLVEFRTIARESLSCLSPSM
jgi:hypothetical protein